MNKKIDITSTVLEKGIDAAKGFLEKLITPAVEEAGLLLKDQVTLWKFNKQVRMLNKAKAICEKNNISPKAIPLKLLCPLLDFSGIEEDEVLHDKWAILLSNMVDSEQNIENHVFPYILSQLSKKEFALLEKTFDDKQERIRKLNSALKEIQIEKPEIALETNKRIEEIELKIQQIRETIGKQYNDEIRDLITKKSTQVKKIRDIEYREKLILASLPKPETIELDNILPFEISNLIRLGVVKEIKEFQANPGPIEIENDGGEYLNADVEIEMESFIENILTELGELFINACKEKVRNKI